MQKVLILMNIRLKEVSDQIHGASGMAIVEAILMGKGQAVPCAPVPQERAEK